MTMKYFNDGATPPMVFGYDMEDPNQADLIAAAIAANWTDVTASWPPQPVVAPEDQAAAELASRIGNGIAITSASTPGLNATYSLDTVTMDQIGSVARDFSSGLGLPGDLDTFSYPDSTGQPRTFSGEQLTALYRKQRNLLAALNNQAAMMAHGAAPTWPAQTATIT